MLIQDTDISKIVRKISDHVKSDAALISVGEHSDINIEELISELNKANIAFMGGLFPKVIHGKSILDNGIVINTLTNIESIYLIKNISKKDYQIPKMAFDKDRSYSLFTYVDGLTSNISHYLSQLYENYGMQTNYLGGGAGSLSLEQQPCVFCNDGFHQDAAVVGIMRTSSNIGVRHGWEKVDGPFVITKADGNIIREINWKNPFEVYKTVVETHSGLKFENNDFFEIAKGFPFGIVKNNAECVVRDPLFVNEKGELTCVGELEENTLVDILRGSATSLINAAKLAALEGLENTSSPKKVFIIDCISRILFLEENFEAELTTIIDTIRNEFPDVSIAGALTLGEISSYGEGFLEFYNKTVVVGLLE